MMQCVIIDDEPLAAKLLTSYIDRINQVIVAGIFSNPVEGLSFIQNNSVDFVLLDIQMPELSGLELAKVLKSDISVILTTAYPEYAVQGFEIEALDYLVKPISFQRFVSAIDKLESKNILTDGKHDFLLVKTEYRHQKIDYNDIIYIKGMGDYTAIMYGGDKVLTLENMKSLELKLPMKDFIRVHKSYIIALNKLQYIERNRIKIGDELIPIGATYQERFWERMNT